MYHTKILIIDDRWTSIGSANFDNRSFRLNSEANLNVLCADFAAEQTKWFDADLQNAKLISYEEWRTRPFGEKMKEFGASLLKWQL
jgi:cardiolipin synthase